MCKTTHTCNIYTYIYILYTHVHNYVTKLHMIYGRWSKQYIDIIYIYICMGVYVYIYICVCVRMYVHVCIYVCICMYVCMYCIILEVWSFACLDEIRSFLDAEAAAGKWKPGLFDELGQINA